MIRALLLVIAPSTHWEAIEKAKRGILWVLLVFLLPSILVATALECIGMVRFGNQPVHLGPIQTQIVQLDLKDVLPYGISQSISSLLVVLVLSWSFHFQAKGIHCKSDFTQAFTLAAYGYSPLLLTRFLDGIPFLNTYVCWIIGAVLGVKVLYIGMVRVMKPDPPKALGLYFLGAIVLVAVTGLAHFLNVLLLEGQLNTAIRLGN